MDITLVKVKTQEVDAFMELLKSVDSNIKFTREDMKEKGLPHLDCAIQLQINRGLNIEVYQKSPHTDQYLLSNSHHPLEHKLGVIGTLHLRDENIPTKTKKHKHISRDGIKSLWIP